MERYPSHGMEHIPRLTFSVMDHSVVCKEGDRMGLALVRPTTLAWLGV
jgi:hypothetical protein